MLMDSCTWWSYGASKFPLSIFVFYFHIVQILQSYTGWLQVCSRPNETIITYGKHALQQTRSKDAESDIEVAFDMSSQPLLQTAPGTADFHREHERVLLIMSYRQKNRTTNTSRTKSLLRQRTNIPLMAQFHRNTRRSCHWSSKLR